VIVCFLLVFVRFFGLESRQFHLQFLILFLQSLNLVFVACLGASVGATTALSSSTAGATIWLMLWVKFSELQNSSTMFRELVAEPVPMRVRTAKSFSIAGKGT
jgi:hypothetical protein